MQNINLNIETWKDVWLHRGFNISKEPDASLIDVNGIKGFLSPGDIEFLWQLAQTLPKSGAYLEIGSWMGLSSIIISNSLLSALNFDARVYCVDTWEGSPEHQDMEIIKDKGLFELFLANVHSAKMEHFVVPIRRASLEAAKLFPGQSLDIVFVDGDHSYQGCYEDIVAWYPKVKKGGRLLGHDATPDSGVEKAVIDFANQHGFEHTITASPKAYYIWEMFLPKEVS